MRNLFSADSRNELPQGYFWRTFQDILLVREGGIRTVHVSMLHGGNSGWRWRET